MGAIAPGEPDASELIRRILSDDADERMPPPETKKKLTAAQKELLDAVDRRRGRVSAALVAHSADAAGAADGEERGLGAQPDRSLRPGASSKRPGLTPAPEADRRTLARRLSLDLTGLPPTPRRGRRVRQRHVARRLREARRPAAGVAALGRASRPLLARRGPLRRHARHPLRQLPRDVVVPRLGHRAPSTEHAVRPVHDRATWPATCCRTRRSSSKIGSGFNRCNITTNEGGAIDEEYVVLYTRDRTETTSQVWMGLTAGCAVCHDHKFDPLSQRGVLRAGGVLQQHDAERRWTATSRTRRRSSSCRATEDRPRWDELAKADRRPRKQQVDAPQAGGPAGVRRVAGARRSRRTSRPRCPTTDLRPARAAQRRRGQDGRAYESTASRAKLPLPATAEWRPGTLGRQGAYLNQGAVARSGRRRRLRDATRRSRIAAWVKLPAQRRLGRDPGPHGRATTAYRGWDLWVEGRRDRHAHRQQVAGRRAQGRRARRSCRPNEWVHVAVAYDGTSKAAGVQDLCQRRAAADRRRQPTR